MDLLSFLRIFKAVKGAGRSIKVSMFHEFKQEYISIKELIVLTLFYSIRFFCFVFSLCAKRWDSTQEEAFHKIEKLFLLAACFKTLFDPYTENKSPFEFEWQTHILIESN